MRALSLLLAFAACLVAGCASIRDRNVVLRGLHPHPIAADEWSRLTGVYTGPLRADVRTFFGSRGVSTADARLELYGSAERPLAYFKWSTAYSSAITPIGFRTETYTNIPERRYGTPSRVRPSSHAPNELLLKLHPNLLSPTSFTYLILRFQGDGSATVDYLGHFGWRGIGKLLRLTEHPRNVVDMTIDEAPRMLK